MNTCIYIAPVKQKSSEARNNTAADLPSCWWWCWCADRIFNVNVRAIYAVSQVFVLNACTSMSYEITALLSSVILLLL